MVERCKKSQSDHLLLAFVKSGVVRSFMWMHKPVLCAFLNCQHLSFGCTTFVAFSVINPAINYANGRCNLCK